ncbi:uncharacterized protein C11orf91 homolog [Vombatus ursinus]|uniref:uncharacterized protein C11orf91 homolog n=1 Tax=Vombatus ursinus TaxID=29139 RepID=UPI000FFD03D5|nr:uncharacterized protein C11orf91 homolog [Vombatus ursinus]
MPKGRRGCPSPKMSKRPAPPLYFPSLYDRGISSSPLNDFNIWKKLFERGSRRGRGRQDRCVGVCTDKFLKALKDEKLQGIKMKQHLKKPAPLS